MPCLTCIYISFEFEFYQAQALRRTKRFDILYEGRAQLILRTSFVAKKTRRNKENINQRKEISKEGKTDYLGCRSENHLQLLID